MKKYLEKRDKKTNDILAAMKNLRDSEIENNGANAELFAEVVSELSYRGDTSGKTECVLLKADIAKDPDDHNLCPNCETPIPKAEYDHYCGFCGQFIRK